MRNLRINAAVSPSWANRVSGSAAIGCLGVLVATTLSPTGPATASPRVAAAPRTAGTADRRLRIVKTPIGSAWPRLKRHRAIASPTAVAGVRPEVSPAVTVSASATASPDVAASPTAAVSADGTASPQATASAKSTASPQATALPRGTASPQGTASAKAAASSKAAASPKVAASPKAAASSTATSSPGRTNVSIRASGSASPTPIAFPVPHRPRLKTFVVPPCRPGVFFTIRFRKPVDLFVPNSYYVDGPGGDIQVWIKRIHLVRLQVALEREIGADFTIQNFLARIRKELRPAVEQEHAVESGHQYTAHITKGMIGHLRYRVFGLRVGFDQWRILQNCGRLKVNSGVATFPTVREGWKFWETRGWPTMAGDGARGARGVHGTRAPRGRGRKRPSIFARETMGHGGALRRHASGFTTGAPPLTT